MEKQKTTFDGRRVHEYRGVRILESPARGVFSFTFNNGGNQQEYGSPTLDGARRDVDKVIARKESQRRQNQ